MRKKLHQAYVVKRYRFLPEIIKFDFEHYICFMKGGAKPYGEQLKCTWTQNIFGQYDEETSCPKEKDIHVIMELQYPFVVNIF